MKERFSVDEVCERFGVTARTLHYYEEIGLLTDVPRTYGGHRYYEGRSLAQLEQIIRLKELLGISLQEIRILVEMEDKMEALREAYRRGQAPEEKTPFLDEAAPILAEQIERMTARIAKLEELKEGFERRLARVNELRG
ncbi:MerR family transcriptional regulator [Cohnella nanjingensis]|uniref:MerR family transcriptional regulator n=1 Tax=Cohnella nanjingensis TaxID=1387779 RepID=A0A7X0RTQ0_9BACL|nr:MerR family transcriptional regulator [Cohnella nanjingensis]MBB6673363.1 MerR family transcriptional regulator [Cohnella nanjingensis]